MPRRVPWYTTFAMVALPACSEDFERQTAVATSQPREIAADPAYPKSDIISGLRFYSDTLVELAEGSDNWAITWATDYSQYTTWGDGGGFGGTDSEGRASLGVARIQGGPESFSVHNVWGGKDALAEATFTGKSYGILAVDEALFLWRTGEHSRESAFEVQDLFVSHDQGLSFEPAGVAFTPDDFPAGRGFFAPTFLQFGPGYSGSADEYVYTYAPEIKSDEWGIQRPGEIALMRVPQDQLTERDAYEFFSGLDSRGVPGWTSDISARVPVFRDPANGVMHTSVTYNAGLGLYLLITQQHLREPGGYIGIYESQSPWGPWNTILFQDAWKLGLQSGDGSIFWNFSNKWTSDDGRRSVLVYTGRSGDNFGAVTVDFELTSDRPPPRTDWAHKEGSVQKR